ncbi:restriction endonuclease subunit S [Qipengyuania sp. MTN3-11]|uniref:restriction endonuclease subunit S n=1 Tax=Qipengyuania sp. MTN3-11 TaxID=3056557 RepID=UPI0036F1AD82
MSIVSYPDYRESALEFLPSIPSGWTVGRLKDWFELRSSNVDKHSIEDEQEVRLCNYTDVYYNDVIMSSADMMIATARADQIDRFQLRAGDVLITKDSETADDIAVPALVTVNLPGVLCGYHLAILRSRGPASGPFLRYWFLSDYAKSLFEVRANGLTRVGLPQSAINDAPIAIPSVGEQRAIAVFLDRETKKIDATITTQERLIEFLTEKQATAICSAITGRSVVTKPTKHSGVQWLGAIPTHWQVHRLANLFQEVNLPSDETRPILSISIHHGASNDELSEGESGRKVTRSEDRSTYKAVEPGDLVYNMMRAWQGGFGAVKVMGAVSPAYVVARPSSPHLSEYVELVLRTPNAIAEMKRYSRGITDFRMRLYWDRFKDIEIALPPEDEMIEILEHVRQLKAETSRVVDAANRMNAMLRERRAALITAAVTGKIDVRDQNHVSKEEAA